VGTQETPELKEGHVEADQELMQRYETEGDRYLKRMVSAAESWVHYSYPEKKRAGKVWCLSSS
jgi:hypothetical protein